MITVSASGTPSQSSSCYFCAVQYHIQVFIFTGIARTKGTCPQPLRYLADGYHRIFHTLPYQAACPYLAYPALQLTFWRFPLASPTIFVPLRNCENTRMGSGRTANTL
jgi:hypothetical protein